MPKSFAKDEYDSLLITDITDLDPLFFAILVKNNQLFN